MLTSTAQGHNDIVLMVPKYRNSLELWVYQ